MNTFYNTLRDHLKEQQKAAVLLSATCKGNDPLLPLCPLFHGSLGPMLFSDIGVVDYERKRYISGIEVHLQSLLINSHNITWSNHVYFPFDKTRCQQLCDILSKTRYSSRSIKGCQMQCCNDHQESQDGLVHLSKALGFASTCSSVGLPRDHKSRPPTFGQHAVAGS